MSYNSNSIFTLCTEYCIREFHFCSDVLLTFRNVKLSFLFSVFDRYKQTCRCCGQYNTMCARGAGGLAQRGAARAQRNTRGSTENRLHV